jgi:hypothetical protein
MPLSRLSRDEEDGSDEGIVGRNNEDILGEVRMNEETFLRRENEHGKFFFVSAQCSLCTYSYFSISIAVTP